MMSNPPYNDPPLRAPRTSVLERVPVDEITARAREAHPGRTLLLLIGALLFAIGWGIAKLAGVTWLALAWCGTAVQVGWRSARGSLPAEPDMAAVLAENQRLRMEIGRLAGGPGAGPPGVA